jgi:hypothetical protein
MSSLLLAALLASGGGAAAADPKVEGKWLIVYAEEGGRRNTAWEAKVATLRDGTLSYERDGKKQSLKLTFGDNQTLKASLSRGEGKAGGDDKGAHSGVYIAARDYLCISLNPGKKDTGAAAKAGGGTTSSGAFILILRRQREK